MNTELIPEHRTGKATDLEQRYIAGTQEEAIHCYERARKRLLNPLVWHKLMGILSSTFKVTGENGEEMNRLLQVKDHIKISLPAPANKSGGGFDWVRVEKLIDSSVDDNEYIGLRLRAASNPKEENDKNAAHFFDEQATSTFIIERAGTIVTATYHGRNEMLNKDTGNILDNIRNTLVASAAMIGLSELQWTVLLKAFLQDEIGG